MIRYFIAALLTAASLAAQPPGQLIEAGHFKRARAAVEARDQNDPETLYLMAGLKQHWGDLDAAEKFAERAVAANPKDARYHWCLSNVLGSKAEKASVLSQIGLGRRFKKEADLALSLDPNLPGAIENMAQFYIHAPGVIGGDKTKARVLIDQLIKIDPLKGYRVEFDLAQAEKRKPDFGEMVSKALEARPQNYDVQVAYANYRLGQKKFDEAEQHAREAIRLAPDRVQAYSIEAVVMVFKDQWADLDAFLAQAEKTVPDCLLPYSRAANNCLGRKLELPRAERYFRKYLTQEPEPNMPNFANIHWRLGLVMEQMGRKADAIAEWQAAVKLDPNSQAKQELKRVK